MNRLYLAMQHLLRSLESSTIHPAIGCMVWQSQNTSRGLYHDADLAWDLTEIVFQLFDSCQPLVEARNLHIFPLPPLQTDRSW